MTNQADSQGLDMEIEHQCEKLQPETQLLWYTYTFNLGLA